MDIFDDDDTILVINICNWVYQYNNKIINYFPSILIAIEANAVFVRPRIIVSYESKIYSDKTYKKMKSVCSLSCCC